MKDKIIKLLSSANLDDIRLAIELMKGDSWDISQISAIIRTGTPKLPIGGVNPPKPWYYTRINFGDIAACFGGQWRIYHRARAVTDEDLTGYGYIKIEL